MQHKRLLWIVLVFIASTATWAGGVLRPASPPVRPSAARIRDADIRFYQDRVARDRYGARDRAALGALYLARGRATGDAGDFARAESLATASLQRRGRRNAAATQVLAGALMAEHRFAEAWAAMVPQIQADPQDAVARATLGEIALELGRYSAADSLFGSLTVVRTAPAIAPRYARWLELNGQSGEARELLIRTRRDLERGFRVPEEQLAWLDLRIGELALRNGRPELAESAYDRGLTILPDDFRLLSAKARLLAAQGDWAAAVELGERSLAGSFEPATLGLLSDGYAAIGDQAKAAEYARAMEVSVSRQPGAYHRGWALSLLDHHRRVGHVLRKAQEELATRKDVYGYDVAAWALHRSGRDQEAAILADSALARGTRDALLYYHRGMIALALADTAQARTHLAAALEINPAFSPAEAPAARAILRALGRP